MKNRLNPVACLIIAACCVAWNSFGGAEPQPAAGNEALLEKQAVAKVFAGHRFTPPVPLAGPPGLTWYVGTRALTANSLEQMVVGVRRGANFTVELTSFRRDSDTTPWVAAGRSAEAGLANAERLFREQLRKELALEEKAK